MAAYTKENSLADDGTRRKQYSRFLYSHSDFLMKIFGIHLLYSLNGSGNRTNRAMVFCTMHLSRGTSPLT
jgi:predicted subunit of tRNA(5-methylaminomethyl-2-thiouridylate) methyltransferase